MRPRKLKCRSRIFRTSVICFVFNLLFFLKFAISSCDSTNLSRSISTPSHQEYYIYDDGYTDVDIMKEDGTLASPDFYFEDNFSTSFEKAGATGSFPNFNFNHHHVNRDESSKGETSANNEFPVLSEDQSIYDTEIESMHQISNNKSESVFSKDNAPVITKRRDEEILVHHHRVLKSRFRDIIVSPPPTQQSKMHVNSPRPTKGLILNEFMRGKPISAVVVPHNNKGPPSGPPPPPPPAPTLIIPKRVNGKPKVPGFDIFDYRKRQYGRCTNI